VKPSLMDCGAPETIPQIRPWLGKAERDAVAEVLASGWITEGAATEAFGAGLNAMMGVEHGVFAPNGTLALALGLMALEIGAGDEVLVPDTTFAGSATAVMLTGATPVFVDVEPDSFQFDIARAETAVTPRTRAVMPVHLYGGVCDMEAVNAFAARHGLFVVEDAAQAIGVTRSGRHAGALGDVGCFSFFADKTITTGEGGYVVCRDPAVHRRLLYLRNQGRLKRGSFIHDQIGFNFRITDIQAAMGLAQLRRLDAIVAAKRAHHRAYREALVDVSQVRVLHATPEDGFVPFRCVLMAERAPELMAWLKTRNIEVRTVFAPLHRQPCFVGHPRVVAGADDGFPNADFAYEHGVCLPMFPDLTPAQISRVVAAVVEFYC
jgi:perosamine synthetase